MHRFKEKLYDVIFKSDTQLGKFFDIVLLVTILGSVLVVCLDSVREIRLEHGLMLRRAEWVFTLLFTLEYLGRVISVRKPLAYIFSFYGLVDLVAVLPTYLAVIVPSAHSLLVVRIFRMLRVFRILKLGPYLAEAQMLSAALRGSRRKILVFLLSVITIVLVAATLMYLIEGEENGFDSIPRAMYWAIVTVTTVGYGDISPHTVGGQCLASILMIVGYTIIAVPTGIVSSEFMRAQNKSSDDAHCKTCGSALEDRRG
ncbi:MAG: ion transporter [Myxococcota bacterium]